MRSNSMLLLILLLFPALACQEEEVKLVPIDPNVIDIIAEGKKRCESAVASFPIREKLEPVLSAFEEQYGHAVSVPTDYYGDVTAAAVKLKVYLDNYEFIFAMVGTGWTAYVHLPTAKTCIEDAAVVRMWNGKQSIYWQNSPGQPQCPHEVYSCESTAGTYIHGANSGYSFFDGKQSTFLQGIQKAGYVLVKTCKGKSCDEFSTSRDDYARAVEDLGEPLNFKDVLPKRIADLAECPTC